MELTPHVESRPDVLDGRPVVAGTRLAVDLILDLMASGTSEEEIVARHPELRLEQVRGCLAYAAEVIRGDHLPLVESLPSELQPLALDAELRARHAQCKAEVEAVANDTWIWSSDRFSNWYPAQDRLDLHALGEVVSHLGRRCRAPMPAKPPTGSASCLSA